MKRTRINEIKDCLIDMPVNIIRVFMHIYKLDMICTNKKGIHAKMYHTNYLNVQIVDKY